MILLSSSLNQDAVEQRGTHAPAQLSTVQANVLLLDKWSISTFTVRTCHSGIDVLIVNSAGLTTQLLRT